MKRGKTIKIGLVIVAIAVLTILVLLGWRHIADLGLKFDDMPIQEQTEVYDGEIEDGLNSEREDLNVVALKSEKYFLKRNLERYLTYQEQHPELSNAIIVRDVNSNLDKTKYEDVVDADLSYGILSMINKYNYLGEYEPDDLVDLGSNYGSGHNMLRQEAAEAFVKMVDAAVSDGIVLRNISAYRSYTVQKQLYANYSARDGSELADTYSSRAGYSEHQAGLATDINSVDTDFQYTKEFAWLQAHAAEYGFIMRYPDGLEEITGFMYEPWHYRYVGIDAAKQIKDEGITFDEYYAYYVVGDSDE